MGRDFLEMMRSLLVCWRGRSDNPVLAYYAAQRRVLNRFALRLAIISVIAAITYFVLTAGSLLVPPSQREGVWDLLNGVIFIVPVILLILIPPFLDEERLRELSLTQVEPTGILFGFAFRPMILSAMLGLALGILLGKWGLDVWRVGPRIANGIGYAALGVALPIGFCLMMLRRWVAGPGHGVAALVTMPLQGALFGVMAPMEGPVGKTAITVIAVLWLLSQVQLYFMEGRARIAGALDPEVLVRELPWHREFALWQQRLGWNGVRCLFWVALPMLMLQCIVHVAMLRFGPPTMQDLFERTDDRYRDFVEPLWFLWIVPVSTALGLMVTRVSFRRPIPMLSGGLIPSVLMYSLPQSVLAGTATAAYLAGVDLSLAGAILFGVFTSGFFLLVSATMTLIMLPMTTSRWMSWALIALMLALPLFGNDYPEDALPLGIAIAAVVFPKWLVYRFHRKLLLNVPLGRLSTD